MLEKPVRFLMLSFIVCCMVFTGAANKQVIDTTVNFEINDECKIPDTLLRSQTGIPSWNDSFFHKAEKRVLYDIEQRRNGKNDTWIFFILLQMLLGLVVLKLAFSNEFEDLFSLLFHLKPASPVTRFSRNDITIPSLLLNVIFIAAVSLFARFVFLYFYPGSVLHNNIAILSLIFLFTFFSFTKYTLLKYTGSLFELKQAADEYLFNLSVASKTIGISMLPILFALYVSADRYFILIFSAAMVMIAAVITSTVVRGLSTSLKLMYSSPYHFLIYICVGEILPIFLFIKLLTKTVI